MADKTVTYRLSADISGFQARMAQASASVKKFAADSTAANKQGDTFRKGFSTLGSTAGKFGLVAAAGLGAAVVAAANFDQAMSAVQAATHESAGNMELLRDAAIKAGAETAFSASEAADGIEQLAKAGVSTADILNGGLNGALDLAAAGSIGVGEAAETAATAMTQFGLSGEQVPHVADLLAAAAGKAQGEVSDFGMALKQSGLVAAQMGVSLEETTGTLGAFASAGLLGSDAGTSFKTMLLRLANPSAEAAALMEKLGISAYDAQGNFVGVADLAGQIQVAFQGQTQATRDAALATIFGSDAIRAANVLYNQGEQGIQQWTNRVDDAGYAAETAATRLDNLKGDLEALKGSLETALIGTGEGAQGPLRGLVQGLTNVINAYNKLPPAAQSATSSLLGITAAVGGATWFASKIVRGVADSKQALEGLGVSANSTKTALAGIGKGLEFTALIVGLSALDDALDEAFNKSIDQTNLGRSLDALAKGNVTGEIADKLGGDLGGFASDIDTVNSKWAQFNGLLAKPVPGDSSIDDARKEIELLDQALAGMVEGGREKQAAAAFKVLQDAAVAGGNSVEDVTSQFKQYQIALSNLGGGTDAVGALIAGGLGALKGLVPPIKAVGGAAHDAADDVLTFKGALDELNGTLDRRDAMRGFADAMDNLRATVKESGAGSREAIAAFDDTARSIVDVSKTMKGANKVNFLTAQTKQLENLAKQLGIAPSKFGPVIAGLRKSAAAADKTSGAQRKLIGLYGLTPKQVATLIGQPGMPKSQSDIRSLLKQYGLTPKQIRTAVALLGVSAAESQLNALSRDRYAQIHVSTVRSGGGFEAGIGGKPVATGGYITGPGTATSDSIPARLSNGEFVVRAAAVQRYGTEFLHAVNAMRFAQGGFVGRPTVNVAPNVTATASLSEAGMRAFGQVVAPYVAAAIVQANKGHAQSALAGRRT